MCSSLDFLIGRELGDKTGKHGIRCFCKHQGIHYFQILTSLRTEKMSTNSSFSVFLEIFICLYQEVSMHSNFSENLSPADFKI